MVSWTWPVERVLLPGVVWRRSSATGTTLDGVRTWFLPELVLAKGVALPAFYFLVSGLPFETVPVCCFLFCIFSPVSPIPLCFWSPD